MKKCIFTSNRLKKAHARTREALRQDNTLSYRVQLGLELRDIIETETKQENHIKKRLKVVHILEDNGFNRMDTFFGSDTLQNVLYRELGIKRFGYSGNLNMYDIADLVATRYPERIYI